MDKTKQVNFNQVISLTKCQNQLQSILWIIATYGDNKFSLVLERNE